MKRARHHFIISRLRSTCFLLLLLPSLNLGCSRNPDPSRAARLFWPPAPPKRSTANLKVEFSGNPSSPACFLALPRFCGEPCVLNQCHTLFPIYYFRQQQQQYRNSQRQLTSDGAMSQQAVYPAKTTNACARCRERKVRCMLSFPSLQDYCSGIEAEAMARFRRNQVQELRGKTKYKILLLENLIPL